MSSPNALRTAVGSADTSLPLSSPADLGQSGVVLVESERIYFANATDMSLASCTRGYDGTVASAHPVGATVTLVEALPTVPVVPALLTNSLTDPSGTITADQLDQVSCLVCTCTGAKTITLATPSNPASVRTLFVANKTASAGALTCNTIAIAAGSGQSFLWDGSEWCAI